MSTHAAAQSLTIAHDMGWVPGQETASVASNVVEVYHLVHARTKAPVRPSDASHNQQKQVAD